MVLTQLKINPELKSLIPPLTPDEYSQLEQNILGEGIREKIVIWQGVVIDGHNRYEIAQKHGLEIETIEKDFESIEDVKIWIIKNQFGRRNLSAYDRSRLALELEPLISEKAKENLKTAEPGIRGGSPLQKSEKANTQKELATIAGVSHDTIAKVKTIESKAAPEVKEKLRSGEVSINQAYQDIKNEIRKRELEAQKEKHKQLILQSDKSSNKIDIYTTEKKYNVIYADPPWPISKTKWDKWESTIDDKYPTMTLEEIERIPVNKISSENSTLFLWTTNTFLHAAFHVLEFWGFKYYCTITWDKGGGWTQDGFHKSAEFLLFGYKGKMIVEETGEAIPTVFREPKREHSRKPETMREIIQNKIIGTKVELFARNYFDGWDSWGNEI